MASAVSEWFCYVARKVSLYVILNEVKDLSFLTNLAKDERSFGVPQDDMRRL